MDQEEVTRRVRAWAIREGLLPAGDAGPPTVEDVKRLLEREYPGYHLDTGSLEVREGRITTYRRQLAATLGVDEPEFDEHDEHDQHDETPGAVARGAQA